MPDHQPYTYQKVGIKSAIKVGTKGGIKVGIKLGQ